LAALFGKLWGVRRRAAPALTGARLASHNPELAIDELCGILGDEVDQAAW